MGVFLDSERQRQAAFKKTSRFISESARSDGQYRGKYYPFFLPKEVADENLFYQIRSSALEYFASKGIHWHQGSANQPSQHLCSSQVCCANFLFPFLNRPEALRRLLQPVYPDIDSIKPMEADRFIAFEWIGLENYLGEKVRVGNTRTRGANFTSADAAVMFERTDGIRQIVLIEWKYTESYSSQSKKVSNSGTDRTKIYRPLFDSLDCPLDKSKIPDSDSLFFEPIYQMMRQQFLAHGMEQAREFGASEVTVLHIAPAHNKDFQKVTAPDLEGLGQSVIDIWKQIASPGKFLSAHTEELFQAFPIGDFPDLGEWWQYMKDRYGWLIE